MIQTPRYLRTLDFCGYIPGTLTPFPDSAINWLTGPTPDQIRIEAWLAKHLNDLTVLPEEAVLLHVGIGDSSFAHKFCPWVRAVHGLTLGKREQAYASASGIPNYQTWRMNKYHPNLLSLIDWVPYAFIVDNNLASYACCQRHFNSMMTSYTLMLREDGMILTDLAGLAHAPGDPNWNLAEDIDEVASQFGLVTVHETESVIALRKMADNG